MCTHTQTDTQMFFLKIIELEGIVLCMSVHTVFSNNGHCNISGPLIFVTDLTN